MSMEYVIEITDFEFGYSRRNMVGKSAVVHVKALTLRYKNFEISLLCIILICFSAVHSRKSLIYPQNMSFVNIP